jgi:two-component system sensor histidine kinase/response regulator
MITSADILKASILIVDDQEANVSLLEQMLKGAGYGSVTSTRNPHEVCDLHRQNHYSLIVLDLLMPGMDGFQVMEGLKAIESGGYLPVLVQTAQPNHKLRALKSGAKDFVSKPFDLPEVLLRVYNLLEVRLLHLQAEKRKKELETSNCDLQHANREIQSFYHTLSHELKTPLTSAREFICIVLDGLAGPVNETQAEYLGFVRESCDQLRTCIDDLFDAARLETGKLSVAFARGSMDALARHVVAVMQPMAAQKNIRLTVEAAAGLPEVAMDGARMVQVLTNLLNNALKFTPEGGDITVKVHLDAGHAELLVVSVSDTGPGMAADQLERIFNRLYQIKRGDASSQLGFGLGLYLCRELVALHGGEIRVESEPGQGSTFSFTVPLEQAVHGPFVLVVDDEEATRSFVERVLTREGFQVRVASDGNEALQSMQTQLPNLVILDLEMPGMNGVATLREIRKRWGLLPVIVHTGYPDGQMMVQALEFSPFTLLAKPSDVKKILATVHGIKRQAATDCGSKAEGQDQTLLEHVTH